MSTTPTESTTPTTFTSTPTTSVVNNTPDATLGQDSFLQLLVAQLQNQDPTSPSDPTEFVSQLAQFSALEQQTDTNQSISSLVSTTGVDQAISLIGRNVTYTASDGSTASGLADSVSIDGSGNVTVDVGGTSVDPSAITTVSQAQSGTQSTSSSTASQ